MKMKEFLFGKNAIEIKYNGEAIEKWYKDIAYKNFVKEFCPDENEFYHVKDTYYKIAKFIISIMETEKINYLVCEVAIQKLTACIVTIADAIFAHIDKQYNTLYYFNYIANELIKAYKDIKNKRKEFTFEYLLTTINGKDFNWESLKKYYFKDEKYQDTLQEISLLFYGISMKALAKCSYNLKTIVTVEKLHALDFEMRYIIYNFNTESVLSSSDGDIEIYKCLNILYNNIRDEIKEIMDIDDDDNPINMIFDMDDEIKLQIKYLEFICGLVISDNTCIKNIYTEDFNVEKDLNDYMTDPNYNIMTINSETNEINLFLTELSESTKNIINRIKDNLLEKANIKLSLIGKIKTEKPVDKPIEENKEYNSTVIEEEPNAEVDAIGYLLFNSFHVSSKMISNIKHLIHECGLVILDDKCIKNIYTEDFDVNEDLDNYIIDPKYISLVMRSNKRLITLYIGKIASQTLEKKIMEIKSELAKANITLEIAKILEFKDAVKDDSEANKGIELFKNLPDLLGEYKYTLLSRIATQLDFSILNKEILMVNKNKDTGNVISNSFKNIKCTNVLYMELNSEDSINLIVELHKKFDPKILELIYRFNTCNYRKDVKIKLINGVE